MSEAAIRNPQKTTIGVDRAFKFVSDTSVTSEHRTFADDAVPSTLVALLPRLIAICMPRRGNRRVLVRTGNRDGRTADGQGLVERSPFVAGAHK